MQNIKKTAAKYEILTIIGARPQIVKSAILSYHLKNHSFINERIVHTGQHYDDNLSANLIEQLELPQPEFYLGVGSGSHAQQTAQMLTGLEEILVTHKPDLVLLYGDTNTTLAAALAAQKLHIPIAHVEAGLRSFNKYMPEEINRIVTDHCAQLLFTPTDLATENLQKEGFSQQQIFQVGDIMLDAAWHFGELAETKSSILSLVDVEEGTYALVTVHRAENTDNPQRLKQIFMSLSLLAGHKPVVCPLHPRTRKALEQLSCLTRFAESIQFIEPVTYLDMLQLQKNASIIITDSGGMQKEAYFQKVPCVTLRDETEWRELVDLGWNVLATPDQSAQKLLDIYLNAAKPDAPHSTSQYGDGSAVGKIIRELETFLIG